MSSAPPRSAPRDRLRGVDGIAPWRTVAFGHLLPVTVSAEELSKAAAARQARGKCDADDPSAHRTYSRLRSIWTVGRHCMRAESEPRFRERQKYEAGGNSRHRCDGHSGRE